MPLIDQHLLLAPSHKTFQEILNAYGLKLISFTLPPKGTKNTTALILTDKGRFALRVYRKTASDARINHELDFISYLRRHGIPTPRVLTDRDHNTISKYKKDGTMWRCILMEFLPGAHPKTYTKKRIRLLAETHARIHRLGISYAKIHPPRGSIMKVLRDDFFSPRLDMKIVKNPTVRAFLEREKKISVPLTGNLPWGYNQLDYARGNILLYKGKLTGVLDFDDITYSPSAICLGYTMWNALYASNKIQNAHTYLAHYSRIRKPTRDELVLLQPIMLLRNYAIGAMEVLLRGEDTSLLRRMLSWEKLLSRGPISFR